VTAVAKAEANGPGECQARVDALRRVLGENIEKRWKPLQVEALSQPSLLTDEQRRLCEEILVAGLQTAVNLLQVLDGEIDVMLLRQYVATIGPEQGAIGRWKERARGERRRKPPAPLSHCLAWYEEQIQEMRALQGIVDCIEAQRQPEKPPWAWDAEVTIPQADPRPVKDPPHICLLVHGILTEAAWQERVANIMNRTRVINVVPLRYGYFDVFRFLFPWVTRLRPIHRLHREIRLVKRRHPNAQMTVIAHSFGAYAVCNLLLDFADLKFDRLILCGSVVPEDYPWTRISEQVRHRIVNECGVKDVWPRLAAACTWGYGASGARGFGSAAVRDRFHPLRHSDFFEEAFVTTYWLPFILYDQIPTSPYESSRDRPPFHFRMLSALPLRWVIATATASVGYGVLSALAQAGVF